MITICLPFRRVTRQKTFQNFYKPQGYSVLEAVPFETAKTNTVPSPGPDDLKQVATKNKNHLKKTLQVSDQEQKWERKAEEIPVLFFHVGLIWLTSSPEADLTLLFSF
jgi:hypothetical protein